MAGEYYTVTSGDLRVVLTVAEAAIALLKLPVKIELRSYQLTFSYCLGYSPEQINSLENLAFKKLLID